MIKRSLKQIAEMAGGRLSGANDDQFIISGVSKDTRTIRPGQLYVPLDIGFRFDGHDFVEEAFAKGAAAALWQQDRPNPPGGVPLILVQDTLQALQALARSYRQQLSVKVIGITGSNGKTTTKDMMKSILSAWGKVHHTDGNLNNHVGLPMTILEAEEDAEWMVLEMGMSGQGEIELLTQIGQPDAAIITNIGEAHLQQLGSRQEIAKAKMEITAGLKPGGILVYPGEEPLLTELLALEPATFFKTCGYAYEPSIKPVSVGFGDSNDVYPLSLQMDSGNDGYYFRLAGGSESFFIPLHGKHNVLNAMAAVVCAKQFGVTDAAIRKGLSRLTISGMRADIVSLPSGAKILNQAFNASPTSVRASIQALIELTGVERRIVVLADMLELGEDEVKYHQDIGTELDPKHIDEVYTYGELAAHIADAARPRYPNGAVRAFEKKSDLIRVLKHTVKNKDVILVKGSRGMRMEEVIEGLLHDEED